MVNSIGHWPAEVALAVTGGRPAVGRHRRIGQMPRSAMLPVVARLPEPDAHGAYFGSQEWETPVTLVRPHVPELTNAEVGAAW
jgi:hypothetical protein